MSAGLIPCLVSVLRFTAGGIVLADCTGTDLIPKKLCFIQHPARPSSIQSAADISNDFAADCMYAPVVLIFTPQWVVDRAGIKPVTLALPVSDVTVTESPTT